MNLGDLCLCLHTREEHFEGDCSRVNCRCKQFALVDFAPALLLALEQLLPHLPDANDAKDYAATNEGRAGQIHVVSIRARELVHRIKNS
jgi:hypothetical protein